MEKEKTEWQLWPHQAKAINSLREAIKRGYSRIVVTIPTGGGKTGVAAEVSRRLAENKKRMFFICHRQELVDQAEKTMRSMGIETGRVTAQRFMMPGAREMSICTVQTLANRLERFYKQGKRLPFEVDYVWWDECHHIAAKTWNRVSSILREWYPNIKEIGLTATPRRPDGKGLDVVFQTMIEAASMSELIDGGYLSPYRLISTKTNLSQIRQMMKNKGATGDYDKKTQSSVISGRVDLIAGESVDLYKKYTPGEKAIVFCADTFHSEKTAAAFRAAGISAEHIDGKTDSWRRRRIINKFHNDELKVICNFNIMTEGFDAPECTVVILARHTRSIVFYQQAIGRGMRGREGKIATIIDQAANWQHPDLGMPDEARAWCLSGKSGQVVRVSGNEKGQAKMRVCRRCNTMSRSSFCPTCKQPMTIPIEMIMHDAEFGVIGGASRKTPPKQASVQAFKYGRSFINSELHKLYINREINPSFDLRGGLEELGRRLQFENPEGWAFHKYKTYLARSGSRR